MDIPFMSKKKLQSNKDKESQKLIDDGEMAMKEIQVILDKYNLVLVGSMKVFTDGLKAEVSLARRQEETKSKLEVNKK